MMKWELAKNINMLIEEYITHFTYISDPSRAKARFAAPSVCRRNKIIIQMKQDTNSIPKALNFNNTSYVTLKTSFEN